MSNIRAELVSAIKATYTAGAGTENDPYREVAEYYLPDGTKIGRIDPYGYGCSGFVPSDSGGIRDSLLSNPTVPG